jgi:hypothetical protein
MAIVKVDKNIHLFFNIDLIFDINNNHHVGIFLTQFQVSV